MFIILYDHPGFLSATERGSPYRDFAVIVRKPHSYSAIFTISFKNCTMPLRCQCGLPTIISRAYDHIIMLILVVSSRSACGAPVRGSCDQPAMYLRATGLRFFQNLSECEVNKTIKATMSVNPYDDDWVSLR